MVIEFSTYIYFLDSSQATPSNGEKYGFRGLFRREPSVIKSTKCEYQQNITSMSCFQEKTSNMYQIVENNKKTSVNKREKM